LPLQADPTSPEARAEVKSKGKEWFQHSDSFTGNLDLAFKLWDAVSTLDVTDLGFERWTDPTLQVYKGTQHAGNNFKDGKLFENANSWLAERR
jgi:hypothetical protein